MKFKEIKPGMVIRCPKEEDARALLEHLKELGYKAENGQRPKLPYNYYIVLDEMFVTWFSVVDEDTKITEFSDLIEPDDFNTPNTSSNALNDKSNAQMSAVEVLEWFAKHYTNAKDMRNTFDGDYWYSLNKLLAENSAEEIIQKITAYEAAKKAPKPVEVEHGWCCEIFWVGKNGWEPINDEEIWNADESAAKDHAAEMAQKFIIDYTTDRQYFSGCKELSETIRKRLEDGDIVSYRAFGICRVKEDK